MGDAAKDDTALEGALGRARTKSKAAIDKNKAADAGEQAAAVAAAKSAIKEVPKHMKDVKTMEVYSGGEEGEAKAISCASLGIQGHFVEPGLLYDARTKCFVPNKIWPKRLLEKTQTRGMHHTEFKAIENITETEKFREFSVDVSLYTSISILSITVELGFFKTDESSEQTQSISFIHKSRSQLVELQAGVLSGAPIEGFDIDPQATHIVTAVHYGADGVFHVTEKSGAGQSYMKMFGKIKGCIDFWFFRVDIGIGISFERQAWWTSDELTYDYFGDHRFRSVAGTFEEFLAIMADICAYKEDEPLSALKPKEFYIVPLDLAKAISRPPEVSKKEAQRAGEAGTMLDSFVFKPMYEEVINLGVKNAKNLGRIRELLEQSVGDVDGACAQIPGFGLQFVAVKSRMKLYKYRLADISHAVDEAETQVAVEPAEERLPFLKKIMTMFSDFKQRTEAGPFGEDCLQRWIHDKGVEIALLNMYLKRSNEHDFRSGKGSLLVELNESVNRSGVVLCFVIWILPDQNSIPTIAAEMDVDLNPFPEKKKRVLAEFAKTEDAWYSDHDELFGARRELGNLFEFARYCREMQKEFPFLRAPYVGFAFDVRPLSESAGPKHAIELYFDGILQKGFKMPPVPEGLEAPGSIPPPSDPKKEKHHEYEEPKPVPRPKPKKAVMIKALKEVKEPETIWPQIVVGSSGQKDPDSTARCLKLIQRTDDTKLKQKKSQEQKPTKKHDKPKQPDPEESEVEKDGQDDEEKEETQKEESETQDPAAANADETSTSDTATSSKAVASKTDLESDAGESTTTEKGDRSRRKKMNIFRKRKAVSERSRTSKKSSRIFRRFRRKKAGAGKSDSSGVSKSSKQKSRLTKVSKTTDKSQKAAKTSHAKKDMTRQKIRFKSVPNATGYLIKYGAVIAQKSAWIPDLPSSELVIEIPKAKKGDIEFEFVNMPPNSVYHVRAASITTMGPSKWTKEITFMTGKAPIWIPEKDGSKTIFGDSKFMVLKKGTEFEPLWVQGGNCVSIPVKKGPDVKKAASKSRVKANEFYVVPRKGVSTCLMPYLEGAEPPRYGLKFDSEQKQPVYGGFILDNGELKQAIAVVDKVPPHTAKIITGLDTEKKKLAETIIKDKKTPFFWIAFDF